MRQLPSTPGRSTAKRGAGPKTVDLHPAPLEKFFEVAFEALPHAVIIFDRRGGILLHNRAARELIGDGLRLPPSLAQLPITTSTGDWNRQCGEILRSARAIACEATARTGDRHLQIGLHPLHIEASSSGDQESFIGGLFCAEDVTDRVTIEQRLAVSERLAAIGKLSAKIAHELNNPLDGILRYVNLAMRRLNELLAPEGLAADDDLQRYLEHTRNGIVRMGDIITSMLDFSRVPPEAAAGSVNRMIEDAITAMQHRAMDSRVSIVCNFQQNDMPPVAGSGVFQVFCNLIKNAIDAMPDGGTLTITTRLAGPECIITFEDTGCGLPDDADKIFEPFFTTKPAGQGTGLGLAICRELIEKQSGTITAQRREPTGSTFIVRLPAETGGENRSNI